MTAARPPARALALAGLATLIALGGQWALVRFAYAGNWTALFYSGAQYAAPPELASEDIYRFADTHGYDGQIYHYIAHDPLMRRGVSPQVDDPRLRYRRILVPLLAWMGAAGESARVDRAYRAVILACVLLGVYWSARSMEALGRSPAWGAAFLLLPASIVSLERMTVDIALAAIVAGWVLGLARESRLQWLALAMAPLVRETGLVLVAAVIVSALGERRVVRAALGVAAALPALAWFAWVHARTPASDYPNSMVPLGGIVLALAHPAAARTAVQVLDGLALVAIVMAFALAARRLFSGPRSDVAWAAALYALLGIFTQRADNWAHVYDFGRVYTPLLMLLAVEGARSRQWQWAIPWCLLEPRVLFQLTGPAVRAWRGMLS